MDTRLTVVSDRDETEQLESLRDWLAMEPALAGRVRKSTQVPKDGELGGITDALLVALGTGTMPALGMALKAWLSQPRKSDITIRVQAGDKSIEIDAKRVAESRIEDLLEQALRDDPPS